MNATALVPELPGDLLLPETPWSVRLAQLCVAAALLVVTLVIARRRAAVRPAPVSSVAASPHDVALERLVGLRAAATDTAATHIELASIARDFVAACFAIPARERTTEEVAQTLARGGALPLAAVDSLTQVLRACDGVKFAGTLATADETTHRIGAVAAFVAAAREVRPC